MVHFSGWRECEVSGADRIDEVVHVFSVDANQLMRWWWVVLVRPGMGVGGATWPDTGVVLSLVVALDGGVVVWGATYMDVVQRNPMVCPLVELFELLSARAQIHLQFGWKIGRVFNGRERDREQVMEEDGCGLTHGKLRVGDCGCRIWMWGGEARTRRALVKLFV